MKHKHRVTTRVNVNVFSDVPPVMREEPFIGNGTLWDDVVLRGL